MEGMKEKLDPIRILEGIIADLKNRSQNQDEIGDSVVLSKLADKITQVKKQYLFEIAEQEHATVISRQ
jgi:hypothetical protein